MHDSRSSAWRGLVEETRGEQNVVMVGRYPLLQLAWNRCSGKKYLVPETWRDLGSRILSGGWNLKTNKQAQFYMQFCTHKEPGRAVAGAGPLTIVLLFCCCGGSSARCLDELGCQCVAPQDHVIQPQTSSSTFASVITAS